MINSATPARALEGITIESLKTRYFAIKSGFVVGLSEEDFEYTWERVEDDVGDLCRRAAQGRCDVLFYGGSMMGWAAHYIERLRDGETVQFRPRGNSMEGKIEPGQLCTVEPVDHSTLRVGDIVLCKVRGAEYLHLIKAIQGRCFQIGNNRGRINGWIGAEAIYGLCTTIED